jgi:dihydroneopterin aldolase
MDRVFISDLRIETIIGIFDWERVTRQVVRLDLEMAWDNRPAAASEDIGLTLDYAAVSQRIKQFVGAGRFFLVETMAEQIALILLHEFSSPWVRVRVAKPGAVEGAAEVGVQIERGVR